MSNNSWRTSGVEYCNFIFWVYYEINQSWYWRGRVIKYINGVSMEMEQQLHISYM